MHVLLIGSSFVHGCSDLDSHAAAGGPVGTGGL